MTIISGGAANGRDADRSGPTLGQRRQGPVQRPVIQITGHLVCRDRNYEAAAHLATGTILDWMSDKQGIPLPAEAREGRSFELDATDSYPVSAVRFDEFWAVQFDKFDDVVPGRIWRTEATVAHTATNALVGVRLAVIDSGAPSEFSTSVPSVIRDLIRKPGLLDGDGTFLDDRPLIADTEHGTDILVRLIKNLGRTRPVVVCSSTRNFPVFEEAGNFAARLAGLAHVAVISESQVKRLTQEFDREFSVWGGAIRTYNVGFDASIDEVRRHPIATREWLSTRFRKPEHFLAVLRHTFASATVRSGDIEESLPAFRSIRGASLEQKLSALRGPVASEREALLSAKNELLEQKVSELSAEFEFASEEVARAEDERDQYRSVLMAVRAQTERLQAQARSAKSAVEYPTSLEGLDEWVKANFPGRLLLLNRAARAARKSPFNEPRLVYMCLERLANEYVDAKRAGTDVANLFDELGVHLERTGDETRLRQWKEQYFYTHRNVSRFFEWHLKRGSDKNDTTTMRIYFFYDEDDEQVVVGHLPGHLTNDKT